MCSGWQVRQRAAGFSFCRCSLQMPGHGLVQRSTRNNSMCKYTALRALYIWLPVIWARNCNTSNTKTSYCIRRKGTGCVLSGGLELQLLSSLTSAPYAGGWWTAHIGCCTARGRALGTYGVGGVWTTKPFWTLWKIENSLFLQVMKPNFLCWPIRRLVTIPNTPDSRQIFPCVRPVY